MNNPVNTVLRLASTAELEPAAAAGEYAGIPALDQGFIHLSTPAQGRLQPHLDTPRMLGPRIASSSSCLLTRPLTCFAPSLTTLRSTCSSGYALLNRSARSDKHRSTVLRRKGRPCSTRFLHRRHQLNRRPGTPLRGRGAARGRRGARRGLPTRVRGGDSVVVLGGGAHRAAVGCCGGCSYVSRSVRGWFERCRRRQGRVVGRAGATASLSEGKAGAGD